MSSLLTSPFLTFPLNAIDNNLTNKGQNNTNNKSDCHILLLFLELLYCFPEVIHSLTEKFYSVTNNIFGNEEISNTKQQYTGKTKMKIFKRNYIRKLKPQVTLYPSKIKLYKCKEIGLHTISTGCTTLCHYHLENHCFETLTQCTPRACLSVGLSKMNGIDMSIF